jgi:lycopene cyclase domain-containing protein
VAQVTYVVLNLIFLSALALLALVLRKRLPWRAIGVATAALLGATAIFDNLIIWADIVAYDESHISGIKVGLAPIEDFAYAIAAPVLLSIAIELTRGRRGGY